MLKDSIKNIKFSYFFLHQSLTDSKAFRFRLLVSSALYGELLVHLQRKLIQKPCPAILICLQHKSWKKLRNHLIIQHIHQPSTHLPFLAGFNNSENMSNEKVAIVTGANKGIGLAIVKKLCSVFKGTVYLTSRDKMRGLQAVKALEQEGFSPKFHQLDIDCKESIAELHDFLKRTHGGIDVLVNNAGIAFKNSATEPFSYQADVTIRVNFTGTMNVCEALFPLLRKHARVVNMSSYAGHLSRINGHEPEASELRKRLSSAKLTKEDLTDMINSFISLAEEGTHVQAGWPNTAYGVSKVAVSALGRIYQREFDEKRQNDDLIINNVHPGVVDTDMTSHTGPLTPSEGAEAPVYTALLPPSSKDNPKGDFIWLDKTTVNWVDGSLPIKYF